MCFYVQYYIGLPTYLPPSVLFLRKIILLFQFDPKSVYKSVVEMKYSLIP